MMPARPRTKFSKRTWLSIVLAACLACGGGLIDDPTFDLWCGDTLCSPWEATGNVTRVGTWHRSDHGVSLGDGAVLSQLSSHSSVSCIAIDVIADVTASARVSLEMDFDDDGEVEFEQQIPESRWAKLRFTTPTPGAGYYRKVRFSLRKAGTGRAVLAQIEATSADCSVPLPATGRSNGTSCDDATQCNGGACEFRPGFSGIGRAGRVCGECSSDADCASGMRCGSARSVGGWYASCVPEAQDLGLLCSDDAMCASGHCAAVYDAAPATCAECASDLDCPADRVCGTRVSAQGLIFGCIEPGGRELGEPCRRDVECESGVCSGFSCSECSDAVACADGRTCKVAALTTRSTSLSFLMLLGGARLCGYAPRGPGEACNLDEECVSGECELPEPICFECDRERCPDIQDCSVERQITGVCRP